MATLSRGAVPQREGFQLAFETTVGDVDLPFVGVIDGLLDELVLKDALEAAGIDRDEATDVNGELGLSCDQVYDLIDVLNSMYLDGDEEAGQGAEALLEQFGYTLV